MDIYNINIVNITDLQEIRKACRLINIEIETLIEDLLFEEDAIYTDKKSRVEYLRVVLDLLRIKTYELKDPEYTDGVIDLYQDNGTHFTITEHNKTNPIGTIEYVDTQNIIPGNISYEIEKEYQGHHYALRALRIIGKELLESGITSIVITATSPKNYPSIKTIEEFGGTLRYDTKEENGPVPYTCDLERIYSK